MASPTESSGSDSDRDYSSSNNSDSDEDYGPEISLDFEGNIQPYQFEPEYSSDELEDEHNDEEVDETPMNRLEDSSW